MRTLKFLPIDVFYTEDGKHTCATDIRSGHCCMFYGTKRFGTVEICSAAKAKLERADGGRGYLIPADDCQLKYIL
jgi:hypothetical protein